MGKVVKNGWKSKFIVSNEGLIGIVWFESDLENNYRAKVLKLINLLAVTSSVVDVPHPFSQLE